VLDFKLNLFLNMSSAHPVEPLPLPEVKLTVMYLFRSPPAPLKETTVPKYFAVDPVAITFMPADAKPKALKTSL
jgi:hypothetical protein